ncbi:TVP38/TMEM64 family protein [Aerococcus urinaeequi]
MDMHRQKFVQRLIHLLNILGTIATIIFVVWAWRNGLLTDKVAFLKFMGHFGIAAPFVFVIIQFIQTVIPVIPGSVTIPLGVFMFGDIWGFVWNLMPIFLGSIFNFYLARKYGRSLVHMLVGDKYYHKALTWLDDRSGFKRVLILGLILPFMPADVICYVAGLTNLSISRFVQVLAVGNPLPF